MKVKGRYHVFAWTAVFLAAVAIIVVRQHNGYLFTKEFAATTTEIDRLRGVRAILQARIATLQSRAVLAPKVQALGLRVASDADLVNLAIPAKPR